MRPAIQVSPRVLGLRRGLFISMSLILLAMGVSVAWTAFEDGALVDHLNLEIRGVQVAPPGWAPLVVAALVIGLGAMAIVREVIPTWHGDVRVGWREVPGGIELIGLREVARGATLTIPAKAHVELFLHATQKRHYGTITLFGVDVVIEDDAELFDIALAADVIDVGPLARALRARGHTVELEPVLAANVSPDPEAPALERM